MGNIRILFFQNTADILRKDAEQAPKEQIKEMIEQELMKEVKMTKQESIESLVESCKYGLKNMCGTSILVVVCY